MQPLPKSWRPLYAPVAWAALTLLALSAAGSTGAPAATDLLPPGALAPTAQQRLLTPRIASILEQNHYRHIPIDKRLSPLVFDHFMDALDAQHSYFLASDIASFDKY